jgi:hypothetical protein
VPNINPSSETLQNLEGPLSPKPSAQTPNLVLAGEPGLMYDPQAGTVYEPVPGKPGEFKEDARKFTFHRAYVHNPWGTTPEEQFQPKNVFDAPTQATALRIAKRLEALLPACKCTVEQEQNFMIYRHSHTPWAVVATEQGYPRLRLMAGRQALHLVRLGWNAWKGEMKMIVDEVCPDVAVALGAEEPRDW